MKYKIIANPTAGKGMGYLLNPKIEARLKQLGLDYDFVVTERRWHAAELARTAAAEGYDVIAAAGGDGTCNEVLNGLMQAKQARLGNPKMGVICVGRGNDFAYGAGIPTHWEEGCRALAEGKPRCIDIGKLSGQGLPQPERFFGNGIGIGFDAVVNMQAARSKLRGFLNYLVAALRTLLLEYKSPLVRIECDERTITQPSVMVSIMNGRRMGGGFYMTPESTVYDGLLDLCIAHKVSRATILMMLPRFLKPTQVVHPAVQFTRSRQVVITALEGNLPTHADGETLCTDCQQLKIEVIPSQLEVLTLS